MRFVFRLFGKCFLLTLTFRDALLGVGLRRDAVLRDALLGLGLRREADLRLTLREADLRLRGIVLFVSSYLQ